MSFNPYLLKNFPYHFVFGYSQENTQLIVYLLSSLNIHLLQTNFACQQNSGFESEMYSANCRSTFKTSRVIIFHIQSIPRKGEKKLTKYQHRTHLVRIYFTRIDLGVLLLLFLMFCLAYSSSFLTVLLVFLCSQKTRSTCQSILGCSRNGDGGGSSYGVYAPDLFAL